MQPQYEHSPPTSSASTRTVSRPRSATRPAATSPAGPPPSTTTSAVRTSAFATGALIRPVVQHRALVLRVTTDRFRTTAGARPPSPGDRHELDAHRRPRLPLRSPLLRPGRPGGFGGVAVLSALRRAVGVRTAAGRRRRALAGAAGRRAGGRLAGDPPVRRAVAGPGDDVPDDGRRAGPHRRARARPGQRRPPAGHGRPARAGPPAGLHLGVGRRAR